MKINRFVLILFLCFFLWACPGGIFSSRDGNFIEKIIPLTEFNSEFDDYNSTLPLNKNGEGFLIFSSKRDKKDYFNLVQFPIRIDNTDESNPFASTKIGYSSDYIAEHNFVSGFISKTSGNHNILGPFALNNRNLVTYGNSPKYQLLYYADDISGNLDIKVVYQNNNETVGPINVDFLNSSKDDAYPFITNHGDKIYFCSNREGNFDIYEATVGDKNTTNNNTNILQQITKPLQSKIEKMITISSNYDDKCPHIIANNILVFTSNRAGGFGGYDIYYSIKKNEKWTEPINAGSRINTNYDEYRPISVAENSFSFPLIIFSSNRPGGKGGFDLYMTGLIKNYSY